MPLFSCACLSLGNVKLPFLIKCMRNCVCLILIFIWLPCLAILADHDIFTAFFDLFSLTNNTRSAQNILRK